MSKLKSQTSYLDEFEPNLVMMPEKYESFIGKKKVEMLKKFAKPLEGKSWTNINSTLVGGGVAEILRSMVPLARGLGIETEWHAIRGNHIFFQTTKKYHNMLQGIDLPISMEEIFGTYLKTLEDNAKHMAIASDLIVVHDPQPLALINHGVLHGNVLWRCHIDTSNPHDIIWRFVLPYVNQYAGSIFTMPDFIGPGLQVPIYEISPSIDPLAPKNKQHTEEDALDILSPLFEEHDVDSDRPILSAISRYDIHKNQESILTAFHRLRHEKKFKKPPILIFMGNTATDDPEGETVLEMLKNKAGEDPDIKFWVNVKNNDKVVGALMRFSKVFTHVSTKEGFGLVVSEALWQGTPVIGSKVGGIVKQVEDGKNGFLVDAKDVESIAQKMAWILEHEEEAQAIGHHGQEHVRTHFLLPNHTLIFLNLIQYYTKIKTDIPKFRMNGRTYSEIMNSIHNRGLHKTPEPLTKNRKLKKGSDVNFRVR